MKWNVYRWNINRRQIEIFNIFDHGRFRDDVEKLLSEDIEKDEFEEQLKRELRYYFWAKCEYEIGISDWICFLGDHVRKVDIAEQVENNWVIFVDYVWNFKRFFIKQED